jgi:transposase-like protein
VYNLFLECFKRKAGNISSSTVKRKRKSLSIEQKVDLLRKLDNGASVKRLCEEYSVGSSTVYDLKKQQCELLKFYADSDSPKAMSSRKTLHTSRVKDVDRVSFEWFRQRRIEGSHRAHC